MLSQHDLAAFDYPGPQGHHQSGVPSMDLVAEYVTAHPMLAWPALWAGYTTGLAISGVLVWAFIVTARD